MMEAKLCPAHGFVALGSRLAAAAQAI